MSTPVHHNAQQHRFEAWLPVAGGAPGDGRHAHPLEQPLEQPQPLALALCSYRLQGSTLVLHHTEVPPALQGRGLAADLVAAALAWARQQHLHVRPACSYVVRYMRQHPETMDLLEPAAAPPGA